jgi:SEC-C motif-containing protein
MKSRYSAFCVANVDYIEKTQRGDPSIGFNQASTKSFAQSVQWLGLQIVRNFHDKQVENIAYVEFIAWFLQNNQLDSIHELSQFDYDTQLQQWFYCKGLRPTKQIRVANNAPCPCQSGKKYKNCHGGK